MPYAISITAATHERARAKMVSVPAAIGASGSTVFGSAIAINNFETTRRYYSLTVTRLGSKNSPD